MDVKTYSNDNTNYTGRLVKQLADFIDPNQVNNEGDTN
ncbi:unnamed protein product [Acidithrix sp. C25]|nr:unnamed protein product [Acidithrix sp. C25]